MFVSYLVFTKGFLDYRWLSSSRHCRHPYFFWTVSRLQLPQRRQRNLWLLQKLLMCSQNRRSLMRHLRNLLEVPLALPSSIRSVRNVREEHCQDWRTWRLNYRVRLRESFKRPRGSILSTTPWTNSQRSPWHCRPWSTRILEIGTEVRDFSIRWSTLY